ncbi:MAG: ATP-binding protein [bacterium]
MFKKIKGKLFLTYLTIIFLTVAVFGAALVQFLTEYYRKGKEVTLLTNANVVASLSTDYIRQRDGAVKFIAADFGAMAGARILVLDAAGIILGDSADQITAAGQKLLRPEATAALSGKSITTTEIISGIGRVMYVAVPVIDKKKVIGAIFVSSSLNDITELLRELNWKLLTLALASGLAGGVISYLIAGRIAGRLSEMTAAVQAMSGGRLQQRVSVFGDDELSELGTAFNQMADKLVKIEASRQAFVADASHELKTPLSSLQLMVETLQEGAMRDAAMAQEFLSDMHREIERLNRLVTDLLLLTRLDAYPYQIDTEPADLGKLLREAAEIIRPLAEQKEIRLIIETSGNVTASVNATRLLQVFVNLLDNAVKYAPVGGLAKATIVGSDTDVLIRVRDNGPGIPAKEAARIFNRFYRIDKARPRLTGGTGLGLAIVKQIVELHGGRIAVTSAPEQGTEFMVELPKQRRRNEK